MPAKFIKVFLLGASGVGKSALTLRIYGKEYRPEYDPSCEDYYGFKLNVDEKEVSYLLLDSKGLEETPLTDLFYFESEGFLLVYSVTSSESFEAVKELYSLIAEDVRRKVILIGNKSDLQDQRKVTYEQGQQLAEQWKVPFYETSAKKDENVTQAFVEVGKIYNKLLAVESQEGANRSKEIVVQVQDSASRTAKDYIVQLPDGSFDKNESFIVQVKDNASQAPQAYTVQIQDGSVKIKAQEINKAEGVDVRENVADKRLDSFELDVNDIKIQGVDNRAVGCCVAL